MQFHVNNLLTVPIDITIGTIPLRESLPVVTSQPTAPSAASVGVDISLHNMGKDKVTRL